MSDSETKVKICGITNLEDALLSVKFGADALGFNFYPKSVRYISPEKAAKIIRELPDAVLKVGVFVNEDLEKIVETVKTAGLDAVQLHGDETPDFVNEVKKKTNCEVIKAFRVSADFQPEDVLKFEADAILLDSYSTKEYGGTGETFNWKLAFKVNQQVKKLYLAGGISIENVQTAIRRIQPFAVDVCSSIEKHKGKKDRLNLTRFLLITKNFKPENLYDLLSLIELRPAMYFGSKSLTHLNNFLYGFEAAIKLGNCKVQTGKFFTKGFREFVASYFNEEIPAAANWAWFILKKFNGNEENAMDCFFEILEKFKLEKENSIND